MAARKKATTGGTSRRHRWADRWHSKSLMGHARTHPYATAMAATAAVGAGAMLWSRRGTTGSQDSMAMAI